MAEREMTAVWNGPLSASWVEQPDRYDAMLEELGRLVLDAADLAPGERVLDVGCGSGWLAREAAGRVGPEGRVVGVDVSAPLLAVARARGGGVEYLELDAQDGALPAEAFDAVVSRLGVMFFEDAVAAFANLRGATAPGGRLAVVVWQAGPRNGWAMTAVGALVPHVGIPRLAAPGDPGPFSLSDEVRLRGLLADAGWTDVQVRGVETTLLVGGPGDVDDVVAFYERETFVRLLLRDVDPARREAGFAALREAVAARMGEDGMRAGAAVWVVTARR